MLLALTRDRAPRRWYTMQATAEGQAEILIYEDIGPGFFSDGLTAKQFAKDLKALGPVAQLDIRINSVGGDVFDGTAIYNLLRAHAANKTVYVDGVAASIASVIAMAGHKIIIADNAWMMIHNPWGFAMGNADDMRKTAEALDKLQAGLITAYKNKTKRSAEDIQALMSDETWMTAEDAVQEGFADELGPHSAVEPATDAAPYRYRNMPTALQVLRPAASTAGRPPQQKETEMDITVELIRKDHPAVAKAFVDEGKTVGQTDGHAAGIQAERERTAKIHASFTKVWGATPTVAEVAVRDEIVVLGLSVEESEKTFKARKLALLQHAAPGSAGGGSDATPPADLSQLPDEERWKAEWERDPKLREEFGSLAVYRAYMQAEKAGQTKILKTKAA